LFLSLRKQFLGYEEVTQNSDQEPYRRILKQDAHSGETVADLAETTELTISHLDYLYSLADLPIRG
jgi:hypothetical protein